MRIVIAPLAAEHELVITHGNGRQVGLLALQDAAYEPDENAPLEGTIVSARYSGIDHHT